MYEIGNYEDELTYLYFRCIFAQPTDKNYFNCPEDQPVFLNVMLVCIEVRSFATLIYHFLAKFPQQSSTEELQSQNEITPDSVKRELMIKIKNFLAQQQKFYRCQYWS